MFSVTNFETSVVSILTFNVPCATLLPVVFVVTNADIVSLVLVCIFSTFTVHSYSLLIIILSANVVSVSTDSSVGFNFIIILLLGFA